MQMKGFFGNGCSFKENERGQKVDKDGFATASGTFITNIRTCVSVKIGNDAIQIRNTEDRTKVMVTFSRDEWQAFVKGIKNGEFDL